MSRARPDPAPVADDHVLGGAVPGNGSRFGAALADVVDGARHWPQWFTLGNLDIWLRFRRTGLGPLWTTLSFSLMAVALGVVYARVLGEGMRTYLPYVVTGLFVWNFVAATCQEACEAFVDSRHILKQLYLPRMTVVYRTLWRNIVLLGFNSITVIAVIALCRVPVSWSILLALAGFVLLCVNLLWLSLLLSIAATRLRAVSRVVATGMPIALFITPLIWRPNADSPRILTDWNPLYYAVEQVRGPLLGAPPAPWIWVASAGCAVMGSLVALLVFGATRHRIPYWL